MFNDRRVGGTFCAKVYIKNTDYFRVGTTRKLNRSSYIFYFYVCYSLVLQLLVFNSLLYIYCNTVPAFCTRYCIHAISLSVIYKYEQT